MGKRFNVMCALQNEKGGIYYALLSVRGKESFCKKTAQKHSREWKANNMRDSWIEEV